MIIPAMTATGTTTTMIMTGRDIADLIRLGLC